MVDGTEANCLTACNDVFMYCLKFCICAKGIKICFYFGVHNCKTKFVYCIYSDMILTLREYVFKRKGQV